MEKMRRQGRCNVCLKPAKKGGDCWYCPTCGWSQLTAKETKERREKRDNRRAEWLERHGGKVKSPVED